MNKEATSFRLYNVIGVSIINHTQAFRNLTIFVITMSNSRMYQRTRVDRILYSILPSAAYKRTSSTQVQISIRCNTHQSAASIRIRTASSRGMAIEGDVS